MKIVWKKIFFNALLIFYGTKVYLFSAQLMIIFIVPMECVNGNYAVDMFVPRERIGQPLIFDL